MSGHYRQTCGRKQAHSSEAKALAAAKALFRTSGEKLKPYRCVYADHWHIGHPMNKQARAEWERTFNG